MHFCFIFSEGKKYIKIGIFTNSTWIGWKCCEVDMNFMKIMIFNGIGGIPFIKILDDSFFLLWRYLFFRKTQLGYVYITYGAIKKESRRRETHVILLECISWISTEFLIMKNIKYIFYGFENFGIKKWVSRTWWQR